MLRYLQMFISSMASPRYAESLITLASGLYQHFTMASLPLALGYTPSPVIEAVSNPVQQSTTVMGLSVVVAFGAQSAIALFRFTTRCLQSAQFDGFIGMIWAT